MTTNKEKHCWGMLSLQLRQVIVNINTQVLLETPDQRPG